MVNMVWLISFGIFKHSQIKTNFEKSTQFENFLNSNKMMMIHFKVKRKKIKMDKLFRLNIFKISKPSNTVLNAHRHWNIISCTYLSVSLFSQTKLNLNFVIVLKFFFLHLHNIIHACIRTNQNLIIIFLSLFQLWILN